jgi:hypothetical protein
MKARSVVTALLFCLFTSSAPAGPFGLERGMSKQQVISIIGQSSVLSEDPAYGEIRTRTVPKPHSYFEIYDLYFSPTIGLVRIDAVGKDIQSSGGGAAVKDQFDALHAALTETYGPGEDMANNPPDAGTEAGRSPHPLLDLLDVSQQNGSEPLQDGTR